MTTPPTSRRACCRRVFGGIAAFAGLAALAASLAGCSSPTVSFYTLGSGDTPVTSRGTGATLLIEVPPVGVPPQIARTAFVVQTGANQVGVLEQTRWASLPADEIRQALSQNLSQRLNAIDVFGTPHPDGVPVYRVNVSVQRFESWPGSHTLIDAVWSVRALRTQTVMTCRSVISETVASGNDALVAGHRVALAQVAAKMAAGIDALNALPMSRTQTTATTKGASSASAPPPAASVANVPCPAD